ncbi:hypothetical protein [Ruminococcus sp. NK3A76]|uniref:hypothetical protein n=1 Tax=Ruminococcus sp. NK3A76 TaxID=877411 RepID=UPI000A9CDD30|nr:hypothetical protein [Ruminococcus sp. NK3A76]
MKKYVTLTDSDRDKALIKRIEKYQKDKKLKSFVEAVRELCETALDFEKIKRK